jgi:hypothetical protein
LLGLLEIFGAAAADIMCTATEMPCVGLQEYTPLLLLLLLLLQLQTKCAWGSGLHTHSSCRCSLVLNAAAVAAASLISCAGVITASAAAHLFHCSCCYMLLRLLQTACVGLQDYTHSSCCCSPVSLAAAPFKLLQTS